MSDLISRELAVSHPFANGQYDHENDNEDFILGFEAYKEWLEQLPSAEPQIIRCRKCKHYEHDVINEEYGVCCNPQWVVGNVGCGVTSNDFCSYAERRKDE